MALGKVVGTTYTPGTSTGFADNLSTGFSAPFSMTEDKVADKTTVAYTAVVYGLIGFMVAKLLD